MERYIYISLYLKGPWNLFLTILQKFSNFIFFQTRQIFLGLCLPETCDRTSILSLLRASADRVEKEGNGTHHSSGPRIVIVTVKPVPESNYSALDDPKVYILG